MSSPTQSSITEATIQQSTDTHNGGKAPKRGMTDNELRPTTRSKGMKANAEVPKTIEKIIKDTAQVNDSKYYLTSLIFPDKVLLELPATERTPSPIPAKAVSLPGAPLTPPRDTRRATPKISPRPIQEGVTNMLIKRRKELFVSEEVQYLGKPNMVTTDYSFMHSKDFKANVAVLAEHLQEFKRATEAHRINPQDHIRPNEPTPITFAVVVRIDSDSPFLRSDSAWSPQSRSTFPKTKQTFIGRRALHEVFYEDHDLSMAHLASLFELACEYGLPGSRGVFTPSGADRQAIKFRNALFTRFGFNERKEKLADNDPRAALQIENWLTHTDAASSELEKIKATHTVNFLNAYNISGNLIFPADYQKELEGATCIVYFNLLHWSFNSTDTLAADVVSLSVLQAAYRQGPTPSPKRTIALKDPFSPSKRQKVEEE
ncbi:hypothetical protein PHLCEN_2v554 [Hermanssonia centrifuga]|uniref:Uncharacterized protein n=1 Tax=Hermanssonia centrifuga TaxID=98765 RepID=A0A2R6S5R0_9APHY|nr:hypothetical protein PHLCEN_2v554 [Hermanssonia centrifuga]